MGSKKKRPFEKDAKLEWGNGWKALGAEFMMKSAANSRKVGGISRFKEKISHLTF